MVVECVTCYWKDEVGAPCDYCDTNRLWTPHYSNITTKTQRYNMAQAVINHVTGKGINDEHEEDRGEASIEQAVPINSTNLCNTRNNMSQCSCAGSHKGQMTCKYYTKASRAERCMFERFSKLCDNHNAQYHSRKGL